MEELQAIVRNEKYRPLLNELLPTKGDSDTPHDVSDDGSASTGKTTESNCNKRAPSRARKNLPKKTWGKSRKNDNSHEDPDGKNNVGGTDHSSSSKGRAYHSSKQNETGELTTPLVVRTIEELTTLLVVGAIEGLITLLRPDAPLPRSTPLAGGRKVAPVAEDTIEELTLPLVTRKQIMIVQGGLLGALKVEYIALEVDEGRGLEMTHRRVITTPGRESDP